MAKLTEESGDGNEIHTFAMLRYEDPGRHRYVLEVSGLVKGAKAADFEAGPSPAGGPPFFCRLSM